MRLKPGGKSIRCGQQRESKRPPFLAVVMGQTGITTSALKSPMTLFDYLPATWEGTWEKLTVISLRGNWRRKE